VKRVLVVTSHPVSPPWDSADKQIASVVITEVRGYESLYFRRAGVTAGLPGRSVPILTRAGKPGRFERAQAAFLSTALQPHVDIVHAVMSAGPGSARLARLWRALPARLRRPLVYTVPGVLPGARFALVDPATCVVALSEAGADTLKRLGAIDVRVIPPGLQLERWPFVERSAGAERILVAAHLESASALENTIEAISAARPHGVRPRVVLALRRRPGGGDQELIKLRRLAARRGLDIEILEEVPEMGPLVRNASALVYAPRDLGGKADVPLTLLEAMASGRPVITSDLEQFEALGDTVLRVPVGDPTALKDAIDSLENEAAWFARIAAARRLVEREFSAAAAARAYTRLYDEVLSRTAA
jgi:glycosyltransferase involved in cell wall biosynthesis